MTWDYPKIVAWLNIILGCASFWYGVWFFVLAWYWSGSPLPGWIVGAMVKP
jgi:hypothetical protein